MFLVLWSLYRWMWSTKILIHHKDSRQLEPCVQRGDESMCPIQQDGLGQQSQLKMQTFVFNSAWSFSCRCSEAPCSIVFHTKFSGFAHHPKNSRKYKYDFISSKFSILYLYFCSCSYNDTFLHFVEKTGDSSSDTKPFTISLDIFLSPNFFFFSS